MLQRCPGPCSGITRAELLQTATETVSGLHRANILKRCFRFPLMNCDAELDRLIINGAALESFAAESENPQAVPEVVVALRLEDFENLCYPLILCHQSRRPALPADHPFDNVFPHWYWSATTVAAHPDHAWYVNMDGGRMFYGGKDQAFMLWPVRGEGSGAVRHAAEPDDPDLTRPRFECLPTGVHDQLTGLLWQPRASLTDGTVGWREALDSVDRLNDETGSRSWRLPNINELESLVDCTQFGPALPDAHPFTQVDHVYW